ncbi:hypothetical protein LCGC14_2537790, partial [marine sediment metagenome]
TVTSAVANASFATDLASWTDIDESSTASVWAAGALQLSGNGTNFAGRKQQVTTVETGTEHALKVVIGRGPVVFKVGSTDLGEEYISEISLAEGEHSLAFTPSGDFYITITSSLSYPVLVDSVTVESAGIMSLTAPWAAVNFSSLRWHQSADVIYVTGVTATTVNTFEPRKIERRGTRSWALVKYLSEDGPFRVINISKTTIATSALSGSVTLTASKTIFKALVLAYVLRPIGLLHHSSDLSVLVALHRLAGHPCPGQLPNG